MAPTPGSPARPDRRRTRSDGQDARAELLAAALAVVGRRGYHEATIDDVAREAGYSKGAVYWHFASKAELFAALVEEHLERPLAVMVELLETASPDRDLSVAATRTLAEHLRRDPAVLRLEAEYALAAARDPALGARAAEREGRLRGALARALAVRAQRLGAPASVAAAADGMAATILALSAGLAQKHAADPDGFPAELFGDAIALLYRGLVARALDAPPA
jgi:AcrR family transcriptional regulator